MVLSAVALFVRILCRLLFGVTVKGELRKQDKLLIVANHGSFLDGILLGAFLPLKPTYLVHSTVAYRWQFRIGLQFLPHLVVDSTSPLAMKAIIGLLDNRFNSERARRIDNQVRQELQADAELPAVGDGAVDEVGRFERQERAQQDSVKE